ncbi:hypothetical protein ACFL39_00210 [Gemmatimonadota bacterium]
MLPYRRIYSLLGIGVSVLFLVANCSNERLLNISGVDWQLEEVASGRLLGLHSSLAVTSDETVHIAYHDPIRYRLYHAERIADSEWRRAPVDTPGWVGNGIVLLSDTADHLHLFYQDYVVSSIRHTQFDGTDWYSDYIGPASSRGEYVELVDEAGELHLVEMSPDTDKIHYWKGNASTWNYIGHKTLNNDFEFRSCFGFDLYDGKPTIALIYLTCYQEKFGDYRSQPTQLGLDGYEVRIFRYDELLTTSWSDSVYVKVEMGKNSDLVRKHAPKAVAHIYDSEGTLHLIYRDHEGTLLDLCGETIDTGVANGFLRCRKGPGGDLWLLYQVGKGLALAHRPLGSSWERIGMISHVDPDGRMDLHIDSDNVPHVSFYSRNGERLWYGRWDGAP